MDETPKGEWLTNLFSGQFGSFRRRTSFLVISGPPRATDSCTTEQLKGFDMIGVYKIGTAIAKAQGGTSP